jgi:hypothetical protein
MSSFSSHQLPRFSHPQTEFFNAWQKNLVKKFLLSVSTSNHITLWGDICNLEWYALPMWFITSFMPQTERNPKGIHCMPLSHSNPDPSRIRIQNADGMPSILRSCLFTVLRIRVYPGSWFLLILDRGSKNSNKREGRKKLVVIRTFFCIHKFHKI